MLYRYGQSQTKMNKTNDDGTMSVEKYLCPKNIFL